jgi:hypothetical protein
MKSRLNRDDSIGAEASPFSCNTYLNTLKLF